MKKCHDSKECNNPTEDPITDSYCIEKQDEIKFKKLPLLPCNNTNEEYLSNVCMIINVWEKMREMDAFQLPIVIMGKHVEKASMIIML